MSKTKQLGNKMHNCKRMHKHITNLIEEIETICEPNCKIRLDWEYLKVMKQQLYVLQSICDRWIAEFNKVDGKNVYAGVKSIKNAKL